MRVHCFHNNTLIASRGYNIFTSEDLGESWLDRGRPPVDRYKRLLCKSRLVSRCIRAGVQKVLIRANGQSLVCCDNSIFVSDTRFSRYERSNLDTTFFQVLDNSIALAGKYVFFGDYTPNSRRNEVRIFRSEDGINWDMVHTFNKGQVRHVHLLQYDPYTKRIWFSTGDLDHECMIGNADLDFLDIDIIGGGNQSWRTLELHFSQDNIYFGTDNPDGENWIFGLRRQNNEKVPMTKMPGPVYNLREIKGGYIAVTAAESGKGKWDNCAHVYYTSNLNSSDWSDILRLEKDSYPFIAGFGRIHLGASYGSKLMLYGAALKGADDRSIVVRFDETG
jgi:hypothetical protein